MSANLAAVLTAISLIALMAGFPVLIDHWVVTIAKTLPSFFTLGTATVLLYKAFRYPRGTIFTFIGLAQIGVTGWLVWEMIQRGLAWVSLPILVAAIVFGPKSAKASWKWLDVDRYYKNRQKD